tara:strand:- start:2912 stop:5107 length:2196 start_codon:yes stop_codon:yes gene_type:complete
MQHDIKGKLAKLLATEDLVVEHKNVDTAQFNVESRVLTLPTWKISNEDVYDALVAHEVGHALFTPLREWFSEDKYESVPHSFVNIIEDVRIEKLMKRKYAGLAKTFYRGYGQLNEDDFFEIDKPIDEFSFPDRINLYYKIGAFTVVEFDDTEQELVDRIEKVETFEQVLDLAKDLKEHCLQEKEQRLEEQVSQALNIPQEGGTEEMDINDPSENEEEEEGDVDGNPRPEEEAADDFKNQIEDDQDQQDAGGDEFDTETVDSLTKKLKDMVDTGSVESVYVQVPKINLDNIIVSTEEIREELNSHWDAERSARQEYLKEHYGLSINDVYKTDDWENINAAYKKFKSDSAKEVNYLVKEFECKKSASAYARATTSKTGVLDCTKLHTYKYNEDLFKKVTVLPNGKNHGLIFILDWSGSMSEVLLDTCKQLLQLVWFCKKVNIPFDVYAFTNEWHNSYRYRELETDTRDHAEKVVGEMDVAHEFGLLNFISDSSKDFEQDCLNLFRLSGYYCGWRHSTYSVPRKVQLSGTPLNEAVVSLHQIIPAFRERTGVEKVNVSILTDGEAHQLRRNVLVNRPWEDKPYLGQNAINANCFLRNRKTGKVTRFSHSWSEFTKILLDDVKDTYPEVNIIGFRILQRREASQFIRTYLYGGDYWQDLDKKMAQWKKDKCFSLEGTGYAKYFAIAATALNDDYDFEEETNEAMTKAQLKRAFVKSFKVKKSNKKILNEFVDLVA